jgi:signal transduction histidine kinase
MNFFALSGLLVGITSLAVGGFVLANGIQKPLNRVWFLFTASVAVWGLGVFWIAREADPRTALQVWRYAYALGVVWIPIFFYHFALIFCAIPTRRKLVFHYGIGACFFPGLLLSPLLISHVRFVFGSFYYGMGGTLFPIFVLWWVALTLDAHYQVLKSYRKATSPRARGQHQAILVAFVLAYGTGSLAYLPMFGVDVYPYGTFGILFYPVIVTYSVIAHETLDIRTIAHKTVVWLATLALPPALLVWMAIRAQSFLDVSGGWGVSLLAILDALLILLYILRVQPHIDHFFQRRKHNLREALVRLIQDLAVLKGTDEFAGILVRVVQETLYASRASLLLWNEKAGCLQKVRGTESDPSPPPLSDYSFYAWLQHANRVVSRADMEADPDAASVLAAGQAHFQKWGAVLLLPFVYQDRLVGLLHVGEKKTLKVYTGPEREFLDTLRAEASIALNNGLLYDDVLHLKGDLQRRVAELEGLNSSMEMFNYAVAHDLRAPLRSIDGFSRMVLDRYADVLDTAGREYLGYVREASQHMGELIDDLLALGHVTGDTMHVTSVDLTALAEQSIHDLRTADPARNVTCTIAPGLTARGDAHLLRVALANLLGNAWKYTGKRLRAEIGFGMDGENPSVYCVWDNGAGFDMAYVEKLFAPFSRLHARSEFPGDGIGLAIVARVIQRHGGRVWAEGVVDRGAAFYFTLGST